MKILYTMLLLCVCASLASAATITINCSTISSLSVPTGTGTSNCGGFGSLPGGATLNSVTLSYTFDMQGTFFPGDSGSATFGDSTAYAPFNVSGVVAQYPTVGGVGRPAQGSIVAPNAAAAYAAFQNSTSISGSWTTTGNAAGVTMDFRLVANYTPFNPVPEPTTFGLMGGALVGLGMLVRRRS